MASSGSNGSLADVLICPVCCEQFKTPKMIPCGHSFCMEPCLKDLLKSSHACPLCRQDIHAPPSGLADDFPTNFVVQCLVSTNVTNTTEELQSPPSDASDISETDCELHQKQGGYFCGSCLRFLCEECNSTHEEGHKIEELNTISERRIGKLQPLLGEVANSLKFIRGRMESVKDAKVKCGESYQRAVSEILGAVSSFTDFIQEEGKMLVVGAAKGREAGIKALNQLEVQLGDVEVAAMRTEGLAVALMTRFKNNYIRDTGMFDALTNQQEKINKELANIRAPLENTVMVTYRSERKPSNPLGEVMVLSQARAQRGRLNTLMEQNGHAGYEGYHGYVWFSLNHLLMVKFNGTKVLFTPFNERVQTKVSEVDIGITGLEVSPVLGKDGRSLLISDSIHVIRLTIDLSTGRASVCKRTIENAMVYTIVAVCWDAQREGCYVLLSDYVTICHFMFGEPGRGCQYIRLGGEVRYPRAFHMTEFGEMAVCARGGVRFCAKMQPHATFVSISHIYASCLTSRGSDRKWFLSSRHDVMQYSDTLQLEKTFHIENPVNSIHFLDERYFVAATNKTLTVYSIEP